MAISATDQGFFTSDGKLRTDLAGSSSTQKTSATQASGDTSLADQTAAATAAAITEAAVVSVTGSMNVGSTGFDSGVSDLVQQAVSSALKNLGSDGSSSGTRLQLGGTYQNGIMYGTSDSQTTETPDSTSSTTPNKTDVTA